MSQKYGHKLSDTAMAGLADDELERKADEEAPFRTNLVASVVDVESLVPHGRADATFIHYRLAGKEDQIYNEFDRSQSEGKFRLGLAIPSLFLWMALAIADSPLWLLGVAFSVSIAYIGVKCFSDAQMFLYSMVAAGRVPLESIDALRSDQILMVPYNRLLSDDSPEGKRSPSDITLSENEFIREIEEEPPGKLLRSR
jgi:hypothetical protein